MRLGIFRKGMSKTRQSFFGRVMSVLGGGDQITEETWDDIEAVLIQSDLGVKTAGDVVERLRTKAAREGIRDVDKLQVALRQVLKDMLRFPPVMNISGRELSIVLVVGVNGSGKTTTIGKLAHRLKLGGRKVMLCAGDTFRAAAIEQLQQWGQRNDIPVIAGKPGSDPAALVYDAAAAARARGIDVLIIDTAGRLHNNANLMDELSKIKQVSSRIIPDAPHEVLLVLDGTTGQNALDQAREFGKVVNVTGVVITKLDGSAKGGMVFAVFNELGLPVQYVGLGEGIDDLVLFNPENYTLSLFDEN
jgi:fused signal recognition particle receptor